MKSEAAAEWLTRLVAQAYRSSDNGDRFRALIARDREELNPLQAVQKAL